MDPGDKKEESWSWQSIYNTAKLKSSEVLGSMAQDLNELSSVITSEASCVISTTATAISSNLLPSTDNISTVGITVKDTVTFLFDKINGALNPQPDDDDEITYLLEGNKLTDVTSLQHKLNALASDDNTFLQGIEEPLLDRFNAWLEISKNLEDSPFSKKNLAKAMARTPKLKEACEKLLPEKVCYEEFWARYLFKKALLEDEEARLEWKKVADKKRVDQLEWEKETLASHIKLSEEEETKILEQYEHEITIASVKKGKIDALSADVKRGDDEIVNTKMKTDSRPSEDDAKKVELKNGNNDVVDDTVSCSTISTQESSCDDWEKDFDDLEETNS